jgi:DNA-binding MarR family transcriptional regulator
VVPVDDAETIALWGSVIKGVGLANKRMHERLRGEFGLNEAEVDTLVNLGANPDHRDTMTALAASASFTSGGYTKIADRLEQRGLLHRVHVGEDRRVTHLLLTDPGVVVAAQVRERIAAYLGERVVDALGTDTFRTVAEALDRLRGIGQRPG